MNPLSYQAAGEHTKEKMRLFCWMVSVQGDAEAGWVESCRSSHLSHPGICYVSNFEAKPTTGGGNAANAADTISLWAQNALKLNADVDYIKTGRKRDYSEMVAEV